MDGADPRSVVNQGVGSKRYHIAFHGPGGHSYGAFGMVNPMAAMGKTVADLYTLQTPLTQRPPTPPAWWGRHLGERHSARCLP